MTIENETEGSREFLVTEEFAKQRLDQVLSFVCREKTRSFLQKLIKEGQVTVDGDQKKPNYRLREGECIQFEIPPAKEVKIEPENIPLDILYEDSELLVVNKPKGMVVHPSLGHAGGTLVNAVLYHCRGNLSGINGEIRPGIVHRIDMDTTGSLVICKNDRSHVFLAEQMKAHSVNRIYRGIVTGNLKEDKGTITGLIGRDPKDRKKMAVVIQNGKPAVTHYRVLEHLKNADYMEFKLETGRTHQIRVHLSSIGHPLLGDGVYGTSKNPYKLQGQALHALTIGFIHPATGQYMEVSAPIPEYMEKLIQKLR